MCDYGFKKLRYKKDELKKRIKALNTRKKTQSDNESLQTKSPIHTSHEVYTIYENFGI